MTPNSFRAGCHKEMLAVTTQAILPALFSPALCLMLRTCLLAQDSTLFFAKVLPRSMLYYTERCCTSTFHLTKEIGPQKWWTGTFHMIGQDTYGNIKCNPYEHVKRKAQFVKSKQHFALLLIVQWQKHRVRHKVLFCCWNAVVRNGTFMCHWQIMTKFLTTSVVDVQRARVKQDNSKPTQHSATYL